MSVRPSHIFELCRVRYAATQAAIALLLCQAFSAGPANASDPYGIRVLEERAEEMRDEYRSEVEALLRVEPSPEARRQAETVVGVSRSRFEETLQEHFGDLLTEEQAPATAHQTGQLVALVSTSMADSEINALAHALAATGHPGKLVFRGVVDGERINEFALRASVWLADVQGDVESVIDPTIFQDEQAKVVPRLVYFSAAGERVASVDGSTDPSWLIQQVAAGDTGHLGVRGPLEEIAEPSLIDVMKERFAGIDWEAERDRTVDTFWQRAEFAELHRATQDRITRIDPTLVIQQDLRAHNGEVVVAAGTVVNPLQIRPFTRRLIVIDATSEDQIEWLQRLEDVSGLQDILMVANLDRDAGWDGFAQLQARLGRDIHLLTPDVRRRFQLQATPSVVTSEGMEFIVQQFRLPEEELER